MKKYRVLLSVQVTPTALHMDTVSVNSVCSYLAPTALHLDTMSVNSSCSYLAPTALHLDTCL